jgi:hypothetical protein
MLVPSHKGASRGGEKRLVRGSHKAPDVRPESLLAFRPRHACNAGSSEDVNGINFTFVANFSNSRLVEWKRVNL